MSSIASGRSLRRPSTAPTVRPRRHRPLSHRRRQTVRPRPPGMARILRGRRGARPLPLRRPHRHTRPSPRPLRAGHVRRLRDPPRRAVPRRHGARLHHLKKEKACPSEPSPTIPTPTRRHADTPTRRHADTPTRRHADTPTRRHADTPIVVALTSGATEIDGTTYLYGRGLRRAGDHPAVARNPMYFHDADAKDEEINTAAAALLPGAGA